MCNKTLVEALSKFFEREGFDMEFTWSETGVNSHNHKWICSIEYGNWRGGVR